MREKKSKPMYIGDETGKPVPAWWIGCIAIVTLTLCLLAGITFILIYLP